MTWTGWNNGNRHSTGAGYGFKIDAPDRERYFKAEWPCVTVELPKPLGKIAVEVNVDKKSFWADCGELISEDIGRWMLDQGFAPWAKGRPPKFDVQLLGKRAFRVVGLAPGG
jgi:hypothetical protein